MIFKDIIIDKVEINKEKKMLYVYCIEDQSCKLSNPPPPPLHYREVYSFEKLEHVTRQYALVERAVEKISWKDYDN